MNQEHTNKVLLYEFGVSVYMILYMCHSLQPSVDKERMISRIIGKYEVLQKRAARYGIVLTEIPPLQSEDWKLLQTFIESQVDELLLQIAGTQTKVASDIFKAAYVTHMTMLLVGTGIANESEYDSKLAESFSLFFSRIEECATDLDIDLSEMKLEFDEICKNYISGYDLDKLSNLELRLKQKFCGLDLRCKTTDSRHSEVDESRFVTDDIWVVSLVRLPDRDNAEHAFLVLEGQTGKTLKIWFADFVTENDIDFAMPETHHGKVRIEYYESEGEPEDSSSGMLYKCQRRLMDIKHKERILHSSWNIDKTKVETLVRKIEEKQREPPRFNILGNESMLAHSSAKKSSHKETGYNCFTFAKTMLHDLHEKHIYIEEDLGKWVFYSATSRYLVDHLRQPRNRLENPMFTMFLGVLIGGIIVAAFLHFYQLK